MKKFICALLCAAVCAGLSACGGGKYTGITLLQDDYRTFYEIFVGSFCDSDGDKLGDLAGVTSKLDYLNDLCADSDSSLHVGGVWLMPIMPSPTYHKYDVTDYYSVDPAYGTLNDFKALAAACRERGIKLIIDLPVNHTSSEHPWFVSACKSARTEPCADGQNTCGGSCPIHNKYYGYYNFVSESRAGYERVPGSELYYECRFWGGMPDLNLDNSLVRAEILDICKFWLDVGAGGFRLDAVTSYYTGNTTKNTEFLTWLTSEINAYKSDAYIVGEAWADAGTLGSLYKSGVDSLFSFNFAQSTGRIMSAVRTGDGAKLASAEQKWLSDIIESNPAGIDAPFLTNHDMARSSGALMKDETLIKQAAAVYLLMPGNPFIYYGEEIGMSGGSDNDESKRTAMVWSLSDETGVTCSPKNAKVQPVEAGVEEQLRDRRSLLRFYIDAIKVRNAYPAIARGEATAVDTGEKAVYAMRHTGEWGECTVVHNLSDETVKIKIEGTLASSLAAGGKSPRLSDDTLTLPPYSTAVIVP